jgi:hypothetical protein
MVDSKKKGGSMLSDLGALSVPFGLIAARNTLENFIQNREKELKKFQKQQPTKHPKAPVKKTPSPKKKTKAKK